ncbi:MAG TPA: arylsulfatase [Fodinibius sp.]|nr:arylsulfatase [Fodinibius sp.]
MNITTYQKRSITIAGLPFIWSALCLLVISGCQAGSEQQQDTKAGPPNIVYILADDLGYGDVGAYGQEKIKTPNIDRMAAEGMRFTQHYAGSTVCAPSRSVFLTGLHTGHTPIRGNKEIMPIGQEPIPEKYKTVAEVLKEAGYVTGAFGKWGVGYPGSEGAPSNQGFDYFFGYNDQRRAHFYYPEFLFKEQAGQAAERVPLEGNKVRDTSTPNFQHPGAGPPKKRGTYSQDAIMEEALAFIDKQAGGKQPFFAYLPLNLPHASLTVPQSAMEPYLDEEGNSIFEEKPFPGSGYTKQSKPRATYAAMVTLLDDYTGQVIQKLRERGIAKNTLVIFTSDHGPHEEGGNNPAFFNSNGPFRGIKRDLYEGGIRVPMIAWWPGEIEAGTTSGHISAFQDMMPTFADLSGAEPSQTDGISMAPTLTGEKEQPKHDYLYWEFPIAGGKQAVRKGDWKGLRLGVRDNPDAPVELYNLKEDPAEEHNVAEEYPEKVEQMKKIMEQAHRPSELFPLFSTEVSGKRTSE